MKTDVVRTTYVVALLILITAVAMASSEVFVTAQSLTADLESRNLDRIDKSLNDVKAMSYKGEILPFIADLWAQRKDKHPRLPWDVIETKLVQVELADVLLQAVKNGRIKLDFEPMHQLVSGLVDSSDPDLARKAIGALSMVDDDADVDGIHRIAKRKDPATFRVAVATLTQMCNEKAVRAIAELEMSITEPQFKAYIAQRKHDSEEFKKKSAWCDPARSNRLPK